MTIRLQPESVSNLSKYTKPILLVSVVSAMAVVLLFVSFSITKAAKYEGPPKAVIIDQLHADAPNPNFHEKVKGYMEDAGYAVDIYTTESINVDFYKKLPSMGYSFIVIRSHSAMHSAIDSIQGSTPTIGIFTGEKYDESKYTFEQLMGWVLKSRTLQLEFSARASEGPTTMSLTRDESNVYFSIGPKFVDEFMVGTFPDSLIIIGGCNTLENTSIADSLLRRGASGIVGWDNALLSYHNDKVLIETIRSILVDKADIKDAVQHAMEVHGLDPQYSARLHYYSGNTLHHRYLALVAL